MCAQVAIVLEYTLVEFYGFSVIYNPNIICGVPLEVHKL